ncbi:cytochrome c oxidase assembly protein [Phycicoccus flavus]|uniref:Bifunctional copper resistance protein CopD/cytochrome c oxidase assembly protein n=1 Tax=Phycicoccus flavus TaxID=2502783 RepID=A0A8T6R0I4_9MICO|nr:cytochrome c oxidase assembly protein [Phycicoccus flavus]NHA67457.1 bifunctional copper resistance protein CopD/cytochrome c oxidase assembly protein [Phycicoccus flavus]
MSVRERVPTAGGVAPVSLRPLGAALGAALVVLVPAALVTGAVAPLALADPGPFVRWGLPVIDALADLVSVTVVGLLGLAAFVVPERRSTDRRGSATRLAGVLAGVWFVLVLLQVVLGFADLAGSPLTTPGLLDQLLRFAWELETTRVLVLSGLCALVVAVGAQLVTRRAPTAWLSLVALAGVLVLSLTGHAAGSASHEDAVNGLLVHLLGVTLWVGGLVALVVLRPRLGADLGSSVARFSVVATWSFGAVALSGLLQAWIRVGSPGGLLTGYGALVVGKTLVLLLLGWLGWRQRGVLAGRLAADPSDGRAFARLALAEVVLMGVATGFAVVLSRSRPPVPDAVPDPSPVLSLTGYPDPGPVTAADWFTAWRLDWLFVAVAVLAVAVYLGGVRRLRRRGDSWPLLRSVLWVLGWAVFAWATCGAPGIWGRVLFSTHMVMHMTVAMIVPLMLVPAAPVTLALRALPARADRTWGPREVVLQVVHSRLLRVLSNPVVAAALFFFSLAAFYFSPLFGLALTTHTGHLLMLAHFLLTGYLLVQVMIGTDPGPPKWSPMMLLVILFATVSFHAFFGVVVTGSQELLAGDFWRALDLPWSPDPLADQRTAGEIAWGIGEAPTLVLAVVVAAQWYRAETRRAVRADRQADRDGGAELEAYNARLDRLRAEAERMERDGR